MGKYYHKGAHLRGTGNITIINALGSHCEESQKYLDDEAIPKRKIAAVNAMYR